MRECEGCGWPNEEDATSCAQCGRSLPRALGAGAAVDLTQRVRDWLRQGNKIQAIAEYRKATGAGLADAKAAVEAIEAGGAAPKPKGDLSPAAEAGVLELLREGRKIDAIKLYRQHTGKGLYDAKQAVDAMAAEAGLEIPSGSGCLGVLAFGVLIGGAVGALLS